MPTHFHTDLLNHHYLPRIARRIFIRGGQLRGLELLHTGVLSLLSNRRTTNVI